MEVRVEKDFLGEVEIPDTAYYGVQSVRARDNFPITGYKTDVTLIRAIGFVKKAAAMTNAELGQLDKQLAEAIVTASEEIISGKFDDQFIVDPIQGGAGTSFNMNANEIIANRALELLGEKKGNYSIISPNSHVNMAQSTNDVFPTSVNIALIERLHHLVDKIAKLVDALKSKSEEFDNVIKMGRTHLQDAVPIRLGQEFIGYHSVIDRDLERISKSIKGLRSINLGGTSVGTGLNALPEYTEKAVDYLAELTGFELKSSESLIDATQNTDVYTEVSGMLKIHALNISKVANDLRLMSSGPTAGLGEINLPARQSGSSIMPGKVNPVICEVISQVAYQVVGNDATIGMAAENGQLELNVMKPVLVFNLLESISILENGIQIFKEYAIEGMTANIEHCRNMVERSISLVTAINPYVGYEKATEVARIAIETNRPIREICIKNGILTEKEVDTILDLNNLTSPGIAGRDKVYAGK
ncbi:aspartate ammonia-lyase [Oceanobacillus indicireducens]|uniref:aspartate ammonia-lyase n=2 Tax=Oceanobacillus TaxID=182709 RepID=A0A918CZA6_9BACI|nr:aspartate ammonia-lyase [Oceanobacillus indicireducens]GGN50940.1 aspartate ammonia-lyase [Oceanobacillus indicireducens]